MLEAYHNDYDEDGFRTCGTTGMDVHRTAENLVKLHGLTAVVALLVGGVFAFFVAMTRWELIGWLEPAEFYRFLSIHAWNLLIFWMVFMEIAILYVGGAFVLGRKLSLPRVAKAGYVLMLGSALLINYAIWTTSAPNQQPLLTSYAPLPSSPLFYFGVTAFLVSTVVAALPFFATIYREKRANPGKTLPLVAFGAFITAIIATEALLGGIVTFAATFLWRIEVLASMDAAWYRQMYWTIGHGSQQINLVAMITVWYFITHVVGKAEVASEKVSRSAFVLYLFFINMGAAHHLMVDPAVSVGWRVWNTSYAAYGAVIASMIHAFAIPAGLEAGRRKRGEGGGLFGWLWSAPWKDPGFSATTLSIILFGVLGGITGVMMGQMQLNMTWHNTLAVPGHFHGTVATGTTLAFMGLVFYVIRLVFRRGWIAEPLATIQPYLYGGAMGVAVLMMMYLGVLFGVPRRHPTVMDIPGTEFGFGVASPLFAIFGVAAVVAILGGALFVALAVGSLLFGPDLDGGEEGETVAAAVGGAAVPDGGSAAEGVEEAAEETADEATDDEEDHVHAYSMRGTFVITLLFLSVFVVTWALNWYLLSQLWSIGT
jgi:cytochrome c oxidase subunit 1